VGLRWSRFRRVSTDAPHAAPFLIAKTSLDYQSKEKGLSYDGRGGERVVIT